MPVRPRKRRVPPAIIAPRLRMLVMVVSVVVRLRFDCTGRRCGFRLRGD